MYRLINNPDQSADNLVQVYKHESGCCEGTAPTACQYSLTIPTANAVNNIIIQHPVTGANTTLTFTATGAANVVAALQAALSGLIPATTGSRYFEDDTDAVVGVSSETSGSNTIYHITGELVVVSMLHNSVTTVTPTVKCTRIGFCTVSASVGSGAGLLSVNGTVQNMTDIVYGTTTTGDLETAIESALTTGAGAGAWKSVTVTDDTEADKYVITIVAQAGLGLSLDSVDFERTDAGCTTGYIVTV